MTREPKGISTRVNGWVVFLGLPKPKSWCIQLRRSYASLPHGDEEKLLQLLISSLQGPAEEISVMLLESDEAAASLPMKSMKLILGTPRFLDL